MRSAVFPLLLLLTACVGAPDRSQQSSGIPLPPQPDFLPPRAQLADFVLVDKSERALWLYSGGRAFRRFDGLQFGDAPQGHKRFQGDERTPEGRYTIDYRNPRSSYHLSLHISYPNGGDRANAAQYGRSPGGAIFLHGQPNGLAAGHRMQGDWTDGCIALANHEIEELWRLIPDGTPIEIQP
jgi:murein L,D-transpeptidase YafK